MVWPYLKTKKRPSSPIFVLFRLLLLFHSDGELLLRHGFGAKFTLLFCFRWSPDLEAIPKLSPLKQLREKFAAFWGTTSPARIRWCHHQAYNVLIWVSVGMNRLVRAFGPKIDWPNVPFEDLENFIWKKFCVYLIRDVRQCWHLRFLLGGG